MRGSPLLQSSLLLILLAASGMGLVRVTSPTIRGPLPAQNPVTVNPAAAFSRTPFHLQLSAPARSVEIDTGHLVRPSTDVLPISGMLELDVNNPRVAVVVRWQNPPAPGEHRFAKLTLEPPGMETFSHVFDANGDIDDLLELPPPAAR